MAIFSKHKLEFVIIAVLSLIFIYLQSKFFMGDAPSNIAPRFDPGFLAENKSPFGIIAYFIELLGFLPFIFIASMFFREKGRVIMSIIFMSPLLFAALIQLTPDPAVNHKYVMTGVIFMNIFVADFIYRMFVKQGGGMKAIGVMLIIALTGTGLIDAVTSFNLDKGHKIHKIVDNPLLDWIEENTEPDAIFASYYYGTHSITIAGRRLYYGWPYFAWSAGYDTPSRDRALVSFYRASNRKELENFINNADVDYLIIDWELRNHKDFGVPNESLFDENFPLLFRDGNESPQREVKIYKAELLPES